MRRNGFPLLFIFLVLFTCFFAVALVPWAQSPTKASATVVQPLVLYDNFNGPQIDPAKWDDWANTFGMREAIRELSPPYQGQGNNGRLRIFEKSYSWTGNDDSVDYGWFGLRFTNPASVTEISASITVNSASISECQTNPSTGVVRAGIHGRFFNYGGQQDQDVGAEISLTRESSNPTGALRVDADYASMDGTASQYQTLGYVSPGQTAKLRMKWDQPNHQFVFQLNESPLVFMNYGSLPDTAPPFYALKVLQLVQGTPHCTTTPPANTVMDVYFDNLYVNAY
jgi:hypothetical protein